MQETTGHGVGLPISRAKKNTEANCSAFNFCTVIIFYEVDSNCFYSMEIGSQLLCKKIYKIVHRGMLKEFLSRVISFHEVVRRLTV